MPDKNMVPDDQAGDDQEAPERDEPQVAAADDGTPTGETTDGEADGAGETAGDLAEDLAGDDAEDDDDEADDGADDEADDGTVDAPPADPADGLAGDDTAAEEAADEADDDAADDDGATIAAPPAGARTTDAGAGVEEPDADWPAGDGPGQVETDSGETLQDDDLPGDDFADDDLLDEAADPETPQDRLMELAYQHPVTRTTVAANPNAYEGLLEWLADLDDPAVTAALDRRDRLESGEEAPTEAAGGDGSGGYPPGPGGDRSGVAPASFGPGHVPASQDVPPAPEMPAWPTAEARDDHGGYGYGDEGTLAATQMAGEAYRGGQAPSPHEAAPIMTPGGPGDPGWQSAPTWQPGAAPEPAKRKGGKLLPIIGGAAAGAVVVAVLLFLLVPSARFWEEDPGSPGTASAADAVKDKSQADAGAAAPSDGAAAQPTEGAAQQAPEPSEAPATQPPAPCTTPVSADVTNAQMQESVLNVTLSLHSQCPSGQVLATPKQQVDIMREGAPVATGTVNLAESPIAVGGPAGEATWDVTFPEVSFSASPDEILAAGTSVSLPGQQNAEVPLNQGQTQLGSYADPVKPGNALAKKWLEGRSASDTAWVRSNLVGQWVPQISSKRPGLKADGITYDNAAIWEHYVRVKSQYPDARLLWSGDWHNYTYSDFWVIIVGVGYFSGDEANYWCDAQGIAPDDCFATQLRTSGSKEGATQYRN